MIMRNTRTNPRRTNQGRQYPQSSDHRNSETKAAGPWCWRRHDSHVLGWQGGRHNQTWAQGLALCQGTSSEVAQCPKSWKRHVSVSSSYTSPRILFPSSLPTGNAPSSLLSPPCPCLSPYLSTPADPLGSTGNTLDTPPRSCQCQTLLLLGQYLSMFGSQLYNSVWLCCFWSGYYALRKLLPPWFGWRKWMWVYC